MPVETRGMAIFEFESNRCRIQLRLFRQKHLLVKRPVDQVSDQEDSENTRRRQKQLNRLRTNPP